VALVLRTTPIELSDPTLGRLFAPRLTVGVMREVEKRVRRPIDPDEFIAKFLAIIVRSVPDNATADEDALKAGKSVAEETILELTREARDALAAAYIVEMYSVVGKGSTGSAVEQANSAIEEVATGDACATDQSPTGRPAEKLRDLVLGELDRFHRSARDIAKKFGPAGGTELMTSIPRAAAPLTGMAAFEAPLDETMRKILDDPIQRHIQEMSRLTPMITAQRLADQWSRAEMLFTKPLLDEVVRSNRSYIETIRQTFSSFREQFGPASNMYRAIKAATAQQKEWQRSIAATREVWESMAATTRPSFGEFRNAVSDSVASVLEAHRRMLPTTSKFEEMLEQQRRDWATITGANSVVKHLADQMAYAARTAAPLADVIAQTHSTLSDTLGKVTASLRAASLTGPYDGGLLAQSLTAAIAQHADWAQVQELQGRSFLLDALRKFESRAGLEDEADLGLVETETASADIDGLFASILEIFADYLARAKSVFEQEALFNVMVFVMTAATLYVTLDQRDLARKSLDVSIESLEVARKQSEETGHDAAEQAKRTADDKAKDERLATALEHLEAALSSHHQDQASQRITRYVVQYKVPLKAERRMKSATITTLYPNQVVELVGRDAEWIEVRYYDHLEGQIRSGWVIKKYLRIEKR
jgi:hypothetical protein